MKRWLVALIVVIASLLVLAGATLALALTVGPAVFTRTATVDERVSVTGEGRTASLEVGAGWAVRQVPWDAGRATVISPDGEMALSLRIVPADSPDSALDGAGAGRLGPFSTEATGAGQLVHARAVDGSAVAGLLRTPEGVLLFVSTAPQGYDAQLAELLATAEVGS